MNNHEIMMSEYYAAREYWELQCEAATSGYAAEVAEYREQHPPPTLKDFLRDRRGLNAA